MKKAYVLHHLGLGDHIICNAIYRNIAEKYDMCVLPVKTRNQESLIDMLSDLKNVHIIPLDDNFSDRMMTQAQYQYEILGFDIIKLGIFGENFFCDNTTRFDAGFYSQMDIDFKKRWSDFSYPRNMTKERALFKQLCGDNIKEGEYIFLHEDNNRGFMIDRSLVPLREKYKIITPCEAGVGSFFDYGYILENAVSIHCIESSFMFLIDSLKMSPKIKKYAHRYARPEASGDPRHEPSYKLNWNVLTK